MKEQGIFKRFIHNRFLGVIGNRNGQAVVEYVLLMIIVVSLILGLRGVFTSMNTFMSDFMGEYIVCLMEYGELPSLGVQNTDLAQHKETGKRCSFRKYSATASFSGNGSGGTGGEGSGTNSSTNSSTKNSSNPRSNQTATSNSPSDASKGSTSSSGGSDEGRSSRSSSRTSSPYTRGDISKTGSYATGDAPKPSNDSKVKVLDDQDRAAGRRDSDASQAGRSSRRQGPRTADKYKAVTGNMAQEIEKKTRSVVRKPSSKVLSEGEGSKLVLHKKTFTPPKPEVVTEDKSDNSFEFGNFMKWLIIAGIIIACFILFGGQIMNYSNSDS